MGELLKTAVLLKKEHFTPVVGYVSEEERAKHGTVSGEAALEGKVVALFFSASWCPPCQHFVPVLREMYQELMQRNSELEIIFVSMDKNSNEMIEYFKEKHGDWLALKYDDPLKDILVEKYNISIIPKLVVIGPEGDVITSKGRKDVQDKGLISFRGWHFAMISAAKKADQQQQQLLLEQLEAEAEAEAKESSRTSSPNNRRNSEI